MKQVFEIDVGEKITASKLRYLLFYGGMEVHHNKYFDTMGVKEITEQSIHPPFGGWTCTCIPKDGRCTCDNAIKPNDKLSSGFFELPRQRKEALEFLDKEIAELEIAEPFIHPTAIIDNAAIGKGTKIWHFSHVSDGASIGENCIIGQNVFIGEGVKIGRDCKIQNNTFIPEGVVIESEVFLGPSVTFTNVPNPRAFISRKDEFWKTVVKTGASIGANATILPGITIGRYAMIGAGAVVTKDIGDFQVAFGNPAKVVGTISMDGAKITYFEGRK